MLVLKSESLFKSFNVYKSSLLSLISDFLGSKIKLYKRWVESKIPSLQRKNLYNMERMLDVRALRNPLYTTGKIKFIRRFIKINNSRKSLLKLKKPPKNLKVGTDFYLIDKMKICFMGFFYKYGQKLKIL